MGCGPWSIGCGLRGLWAMGCGLRASWAVNIPTFVKILTFNYSDICNYSNIRENPENVEYRTCLEVLIGHCEFLFW